MLDAGCLAAGRFHEVTRPMLSSAGAWRRLINAAHQVLIVNLIESLPRFLASGNSGTAQIRCSNSSFRTTDNCAAGSRRRRLPQTLRQFEFPNRRIRDRFSPILSEIRIEQEAIGLHIEPSCSPFETDNTGPLRRRAHKGQPPT